MARAINDAGLNLVREFEGFRAMAYRCPAGVWTIGYGHTARVKPGDAVTLEQAEQLLRKDLDRAGAEVERLITIPLNDNQYAALVSFTFNVGAANLKNSTLRKKLNAGDFDSIPSEMCRWVRATDPHTGRKRTLAGLLRRRTAEGILWLTGNEGMPQQVESVDA